MRLISITLTLIFAATLTIPALGQEQTWEVNFLESASGRLLTVNPGGLQLRAELPEISDFSAISDAVLSPDGAYLVFAGFRTGEAGIYRANLQDATCCTKLPDVIPTGADFVALGDFNPAGTEVVAVLSKINVDDEGASRAGFVVTYNVAGESLGHFVSTSDFANDAADATPLLGAYLGSWSEAGIEVFATCMACDRPVTGVFSVWNPDNVTITPASGLFQGNGNTLPATGETVVTARDDIYPIGQGLLGNVVRYVPSSGIGEVPFVIYNNPDYLLLSSVNWVHNGDSLLIAHAEGDLAVMLERSGSQTALEIPRQNQFLATTPDGWLARNEAEIIKYTIEDGQLAVEVLGNLQGVLISIGGTQMAPLAVMRFPQRLP